MVRYPVNFYKLSLKQNGNFFKLVLQAKVLIRTRNTDLKLET